MSLVNLLYKCEFVVSVKYTVSDVLNTIDNITDSHNFESTYT